MQIQENAYLQFFCGYTEYNDEKPPFDPSLMVYFRKRLTPEILGEINEMIIRNKEKVSSDSPFKEKNGEKTTQSHRSAAFLYQKKLKSN